MLVELVLPVGGQASFYSDRPDEDRGDNLKWDTFLTEELPDLLARDRKTDNHRGAMGVSKGATASVLLTERHPTCSSSSDPCPASSTCPRRACRRRWTRC